MANARIAVIGAGLMGHGIAQVFALAGHDVAIYDSFAAVLDSAKARILTNLEDLGDDPKAVERVTPVGDLAQAVREADYVVEAVIEDLPLKQNLFAEIESYVRTIGSTVYHPCGTCRMGEDDRAVVDSSLRVRGLEGLRVADASVMPAMPSPNIHPATIMVAEKGSDIVGKALVN